MISKIIQYVGVFFIVTFCAVSTFFAIIERDVHSADTKKETMKYATYFESRFFDFRMKYTLNQDYDKRIVLAAIDDESLDPDRIGRWPWNRDVWAKIIDNFKIIGAKIIAFDVFFSEPQLSCDIDYDSILAESMAKFQSEPGYHIVLPYKVVVDKLALYQEFYGPKFTLTEEEFNQVQEPFLEETPDILYNGVMNSQIPADFDISKMFVARTAFPIQKLISFEPSLGHIQAQEDADGIFRHYKAIANIDQVHYPAFSLVVHQLYNEDTDEDIKFEAEKDGWVLRTGKGNLPINRHGEAQVRWLGGESSFPKVSLWDIYKLDPKKIDKLKEKLKDKIVFIGSTAFGAHDFRHTPVDPKMPGVYFHMNFTNMLLDGRYFKNPQTNIFISWSILIGATLVIILVMLFNNALVDILTMVVLVGGIYIVDTFYLIPLGYQLKLFFCLLCVVAIYSWSTFLNFYLTNKEKKQIKGTFSSFVSPAVVNEMLDNPELVKVGGEKKNITVFFSDVRDFTSISEKLTPEELSACLNQYMGVMTDIIFKTSGTLDKYIGDAIVAFWGAPLKVENHAYKAVNAAIEMIEVLPSINESFREQGFPEFKHGIGLNTGDCSVGNMGSDTIFQYTALGDSMNLGARLESLCKYYGVQLNISEYTKAAIPEELQTNLTFRILDKVRVKGKEEAVTIYEVLHPSHPFKKDPDALQGYLTAFDLYLEQNFKGAAEILTPLVEKYPEDKSCKRVLDFSLGYIENPPPADWDGVYTHTTKG
jgi:adenylate cyclase